MSLRTVCFQDLEFESSCINAENCDRKSAIKRLWLMVIFIFYLICKKYSCGWLQFFLLICIDSCRRLSTKSTLSHTRLLAQLKKLNIKCHTKINKSKLTQCIALISIAKQLSFCLSWSFQQCRSSSPWRESASFIIFHLPQKHSTYSCPSHRLRIVLFLLYSLLHAQC